jgi:hemerythrin-like domain-containing protein
VNATDILSEEHQVIGQVLTALEKMADRYEQAKRLDAAEAKDVVDFFRNFADRCHHGKEEAQLFPVLERHGFSPEAGPTAVMRIEHEQGRAHVRAMAEAITRTERGNAAAWPDFVEHARGYVELLRQHIEKENHCLFAMADAALSTSEQKQLLAAFEKVEGEDMGAGTHEEFLALAGRLAERYGVPVATVTAHTCCHHQH